MVDCLFIGHNDLDFGEYEKMVCSMGPKSGAFRDLNLHYINYEGKPYRAMDLLNHFYFQHNPTLNPEDKFHNGDYFWPAIAYLASYIHQRGFSFDYVNNFQKEKESLREKLMKNEIRTIAITTTLYVSVKPIVDIITYIKKYNTTAKIIVGGPFIYSQIRQTDKATIQYLFKSLNADFYVDSSEGELALVRILQALKEGTNFSNIENIWYKHGGIFVANPTSIENNNLEENMINWGIFRKEDMQEFVCLRTAKSCPFACSFCGFPQRAGKYTFLGVDVLERELMAIKDLGKVNSLYFIDDTFNVPKERFKEILQMMIRNKFEFKWHCNYRCQFADEESIQLMKEAGCEGVFLGIESGSDTILKNMNKSSTVDQYRRGVELLNKYGIVSHANLIIGFPGETDETVQETLTFIEQNQPTFWRTQLWYCDPMTPIYKEKDKYQIKGSMFQWAHVTMNSDHACDLIDHAFLTVKNSIWLPQNSFELFSLFYLQRKGMTLEQIKTYVQYFNNLVKEKLTTGPKDLDLIVRIRELCKF